MNPFYFGSSSEPLFGAYHPPIGADNRQSAVLICPPLGREYLRTHWALRRLADQLSRSGYHVLRFDYFANGDSAGETGAGDALRWQQDIHTAAAELTDLSGLSQLSIVGLRAGAALAAATNELETQDLILWDPVISGSDYLKELEALHQTKLVAYNAVRQQPLESTPDEVLGFPMPQIMRESIEQINLLSCINNNAKNIYLFSSKETKALTALKEVAEKNGISFSFQIIPDAGDWDNPASTADAFLPNAILKAIVNKLGGN